MKRTLSIITIMMAILLTACQSVQQAPAETMSMTFMAGYKPQANLPFVGVYVAQEKGFFAGQGLEVTIEHSAGQGEHLQLTASGKVQVTTQDAAVLLQRRSDPELPLVSIALIGQVGQQAFAALDGSGMVSPKDWEGHTVGYKGTPPPDIYALLKATDADINDIKLVNVGYDPRLLTEGKIDVYPVFKSNEPYLIKSWGYDLTLWDASDYGVPTLGLTYVTSDETLQNNPEMLRRFLTAALKGIDYAAENPEEAIDIVLQYAGPETDPAHMRFMLDSELSDIHCDQGTGWQTLEQWQALADMLVEYDIMKGTDVTKVFNNSILEAVKK